MHYTECVVNMQKALPRQPHTHIPDAVRKHQKEVTLPKIKSLYHKKSAINPEKYSSVSEKTDSPTPQTSPWKLGQGHQNLISYWSCPIYIGLQIW